MSEGFTRVQDGITSTRHDHLPLPGGGTVGTEARLHSLLVDDLQIPGTSHHQGREALAATYAQHLEGIRQAAGDAAVATWLKGPFA